jgi:DNA-binding response OmpR family regulator
MAPENEAAGSVHTVLVVDDDPTVLRMVARFLRDPGLEILLAGGSEAALGIAAARPIDLLLTDVVLPGLDGPALAARVRERHAGVRVLFMSGYGAEILAKYGVAEGARRFAPKPFTPELLRECVQRALAEAPS